MVLYYLILAPSLNLWYSPTFYWLSAYTYITLLPSTGLLLLLAPCLSLWYSSILYWLHAYKKGTLLSSTSPLPFTMCCTQLPSTGPLLIPMVPYYLLVAPCLYLWYTTFFYWLTVYPYGTLLSSTDPLPIPRVLYYHLLASCLFLS